MNDSLFVTGGKFCVSLLLVGGILFGFYKCDQKKISKLAEEVDADIYSIVDIVPIKGQDGYYIYAECKHTTEDSSDSTCYVEYKVSNYHYEKFVNMEEYSRNFLSSKEVDQFLDVIVPEYEPSGVFDQHELATRLAHIKYAGEFKDDSAITP